jgi:myo-inositol 2-dehydrogenase/D-chiro-inositol 1-dehydrogenase
MIDIAVIGTGRIGSHHVRALVEDVPAARVAAVVDPALDRARALAAQHGVPHALPSLERALDLVDLDAVVISTPVTTHLALIEQAAAAGLHVLTEKPVAASVTETRAAIDAVRAAGVVFQVGFNRRFAEPWAVAHAAVTAGELGEIHHLHSVTRDPGPFTADPARIPSGTIFRETLIHDFDVISWFMGEARPVGVHTAAEALVVPAAREDGFLDTAVVTIRYDSGAIATAEASFSAAYGYDLRAEVFGTGGMVQIGDPVSSGARFFRASGLSARTAGIDTERFHDSYVAEFSAFCRAIEGGESPGRPSGADGLAAQLLAEAALLSHAEGREVRVEEVAR